MGDVSIRNPVMSRQVIFGQGGVSSAAFQQEDQADLTLECIDDLVHDLCQEIIQVQGLAGSPRDRVQEDEHFIPRLLARIIGFFSFGDIPPPDNLADLFSGGIHQGQNAHIQKTPLPIDLQTSPDLQFPGRGLLVKLGPVAQNLIGRQAKKLFPGNPDKSLGGRVHVDDAVVNIDHHPAIAHALDHYIAGNQGNIQ